MSFTDDFSGGLRIRVINGQLTRSTLFGKPEPLIPVGKNFFREEKEPEATSIFVALDGGGMALSGQGLEGFSYGERAPIAWTYARIALLVLCLVMMATSLLFAIVWILRKLFGGMKDVQHLAVRAIPLLATLAFAAMVFCFTKLGGADTGRFTVWTGGIFVFSLLFPLLSLYGLFLAIRVPKSEIHSATRLHSLLVALACCVLTVFVASWHLVGLRLWTP